MTRTAQALASFGVLSLGFLLTAGLFASRGDAETSPPSATVPAVEILVVEPSDQLVRVTATGVVSADRDVSLSAELSAKIVEVSSSLIPGGRVSAGQPLITLDGRDYRLAVAQEEARVRQAELDLRLEKGRQAIAEEDYQRLGQKAQDSELARRLPQLAVAEANLESARASLQRAKNNLERTVIRAPFNAVVVRETAEAGQLATPGQSLTTLVGTDRLRVTVSVPVEQLSAVFIPGVNGEVGSPAKVSQRLGDGATITRPGAVLSLVGQLESNTRTAQLVVGVESPLGGAGELPMLPGAYVDVVIEGRAAAGAFVVPRAALFDGDQTWVVDAEDRLRRRTLRVISGDSANVLVTEGLSPGDRVLLTPLSLPVEGMVVAPTAAAKEG